jgi:hypothetical protein
MRLRTPKIVDAHGDPIDPTVTYEATDSANGLAPDGTEYAVRRGQVFTGDRPQVHALAHIMKRLGSATPPSPQLEAMYDGEYVPPPQPRPLSRSVICTKRLAVTIPQLGYMAVVEEGDIVAADDGLVRDAPENFRKPTADELAADTTTVAA